MVLLSGGIDSAACLAFYLNQRFTPSALFIDYGQISAKQEGAASSAISDYYQVSLETITISGFREWSGGYIPGRNAFLLYAALLAFKQTVGFIGIGVHAGTTYYDCSKSFIQHLQSSFDSYTDGRIRIGVPFLHWNKREIWDFCHNVKVPLSLTYSCELGREQPCGQCLSCKDTEALHAG